MSDNSKYGQPLDNIKRWSEVAKFYAKFPQLKLLNRLKDSVDLLVVQPLTQDQLNPKYPPSMDINQKLSLWQGDICDLQVDAIVNAAHVGLTGGGGIDGHVHNRAGNELFKECMTLNGCKPGEAKLTKGYLLPAKYIIHTVGPTTPQPEILESCYKSCLDLMVLHACKSIAFCSISTGHYQYPVVEATQIALNTTRKWMEANKDKVERIVFCVYTVRDESVYEVLMPVYFPPSS